ncbi:MAG: hypothetical protein ACJ71W_05850 [Terriglobales bacterium]
MSKWNHSICEECWWKSPNSVENGEPHRLKNATKRICCYCGAETLSGILVNDNPATTPCKGNHPDVPQEGKIELVDLRKYIVKEWLGRSIIVLYEYEQYGWSGFRWVPIGGNVQICNFESEQAAHAYAQGLGFSPASAPTDDEIKAIWRDVANGVGEQGDFLRSLGSAIVLADPENFPIIRPAAIFFIRKYQLESLAARPVAMLPIPEEKGGPENTHS